MSLLLLIPAVVVYILIGAIIACGFEKWFGWEAEQSVFILVLWPLAAPVSLLVELVLRRKR